MFPDVTSCLQFDKMNLNKAFVLVTDDLLGSSDFLTNYMLGYALSLRLRTVFVSWSETFGHYQAIMSRCGVDIVGPLTRGDLVFFDALSGIDSSREKDLDLVYKSIEAAVDESASNSANEGRLVILDHPTNLLDIGIHPSAVLRFLLQCLSLNSCGFFVSVKTSDILLENERLVGILSQSADVVMHVSTLDSGMSRDVSGEVVVHFNLDSSDFAEDAEKLKETLSVESERFLYRLENRRVKMSRPGDALLRR